jgi:hypothetical protein
MQITAATEVRDPPAWVGEMLPYFNNSCNLNPGIEIVFCYNAYSVYDDYCLGCKSDGWSILIFACMATIGQWKEAWSNVESISDDVYSTAGGNGHSKTNTLWYISTRPHNLI